MMESKYAVKVTVSSQDDSHALAEARGHQLVLNIKRATAKPDLARLKRLWLPWAPAF
jgi:hypothetical protein